MLSRCWAADTCLTRGFRNPEMSMTKFLVQSFYNSTGNHWLSRRKQRWKGFSGGEGTSRRGFVRRRHQAACAESCGRRRRRRATGGQEAWQGPHDGGTGAPMGGKQTRRMDLRRSLGDLGESGSCPAHESALWEVVVTR